MVAAARPKPRIRTRQRVAVGQSLHRVLSHVHRMQTAPAPRGGTQGDKYVCREHTVTDRPYTVGSGNACLIFFDQDQDGTNLYHRLKVIQGSPGDINALLDGASLDQRYADALAINTALSTATLMVDTVATYTDTLHRHNILSCGLDIHGRTTINGAASVTPIGAGKGMQWLGNDAPHTRQSVDPGYDSFQVAGRDQSRSVTDVALSQSTLVAPNTPFSTRAVGLPLNEGLGNFAGTIASGLSWLLYPLNNPTGHAARGMPVIHVEATSDNLLVAISGSITVAYAYDAPSVAPLILPGQLDGAYAKRPLDSSVAAAVSRVDIGRTASKPSRTVLNHGGQGSLPAIHSPPGQSGSSREVLPHRSEIVPVVDPAGVHPHISESLWTKFKSGVRSAAGAITDMKDLWDDTKGARDTATQWANQAGKWLSSREAQAAGAARYAARIAPEAEEALPLLLAA